RPCTRLRLGLPDSRANWFSRRQAARVAKSGFAGFAFPEMSGILRRSRGSSLRLGFVFVPRGWVMGFSTIDYVVLFVYLAGITIFGTLFRRSQRTVRDYFIGAKNTHWIVISLSIVATETSTLTLIGVPALAYATYARPSD